MYVCVCTPTVDVLKPLTESAQEVGVEMVFHVKAKTEDGSEQMKTVIQAMRAAAGDDTSHKAEENGVKKEEDDSSKPVCVCACVCARASAWVRRGAQIRTPRMSASLLPAPAHVPSSACVC